MLNFATLYHVRRHGFEFTNQLDRVALAADRRDADLMLTAQRMRGLGFDLPILTPSLLCLGWISAGGDLAA